MPHPLFPKFNELSHYQPGSLPVGDRRSAAILVPVFKRAQNQLLYTMRSQNLNKHAGQISFPGGRVDEGEAPEDAALREAWEEVGLPQKQVELLGEIDECYSPRGFHIRCFVGLCEEFQPVINTSEVEALVDVSLDELFDEKLHSVQLWKDRPVHFFNFKNGTVWGVTGHITYRLREILKQI